jgi:mono/diheme cytochrome c family protein
MKKNNLFLLLLLTGSFAMLAAVRRSAETVMAGSNQAGSNQAGPSQAGLEASMTRGKQVYHDQCLACHQADAGGVQGMNPTLIKTKYVLGPKADLVKIVLNGMKGDLDLDGDTYHNVMAPHSDLTDQQIADVLTYVRNSFGNKAKPITAAEVKTIRASNKPPAP